VKKIRTLTKTRAIDTGARPNKYLSILSTNFNFLPQLLTHTNEDTHQSRLKAPVIEAGPNSSGETGTDRLAGTRLARYDYF
jgi:hypothetical protein